MSKNQKAFEQLAILTQVAPGQQSTGNNDSTYVMANGFHNYAVIAAVGTMGSSATLDVSVLQATDSSGTGAKALVAATQIVEAGSDKPVILSFKPEDLDVNNGFEYVALRLAVATAASDCGGYLVGLDPKDAPATQGSIVAEAV